MKQETYKTINASPPNMNNPKKKKKNIKSQKCKYKV